MTKQINQSHQQYVMRCADLYATESGNKVANREALKQALEAALKPGEPVATLWQHSETGRTRIIQPGDITDCDARWLKAADLFAAPPAQTPTLRCEHCDGTGDVHGLDGEWRGQCICEAAQTPPLAYAPNGDAQRHTLPDQMPMPLLPNPVKAPPRLTDGQMLRMWIDSTGHVDAYGSAIETAVRRQFLGRDE